MPGTIAWATTATAAIVASTSPTASSASGRDLGAQLARRRSTSRPRAAAAAGRRGRRRPGSSSRSGSPGIRPIASPPSTSTIGYGTRTRSASRTQHRGGGEQQDQELDVAQRGGNSRITPPVPDASIPPLGPDDHVDGPARRAARARHVRRLPVPVLHGGAADRAARARPARRAAALRASATSRCASTIPTPQRAAEASEAAAAQGAFWPMHDALYGSARPARARRRPAARRAASGSTPSGSRAELDDGHARGARASATSRARRAAGVDGHADVLRRRRAPRTARSTLSR